LLDRSCRQEGAKKFPFNTALDRIHPASIRCQRTPSSSTPIYRLQTTTSQRAILDCIFGIGTPRGQITQTTNTMASMPAATIYPQSHVGFDSITSQIERKLLKRGFQFNVICVG
jgi:hypothetical protein